MIPQYKIDRLLAVFGHFVEVVRDGVWFGDVARNGDGVGVALLQLAVKAVALLVA